MDHRYIQGEDDDPADLNWFRALEASSPGLFDDDDVCGEGEPLELEFNDALEPSDDVPFDDFDELDWFQ